MAFPPHFFEIIAGGIGLAALIYAIILHIRIRKFFRAGGNDSFEKVLANVLENLNHLNQFEMMNEARARIMEERLRRSVQAVHSHRYNPFKGAGEGGLQSHSTAIVSEEGDGVVISALGVRDRVSIFAKPLNAFESMEVELTPEEQEIVEKAKRSLAAELLNQ